MVAFCGWEKCFVHDSVLQMTLSTLPSFCFEGGEEGLSGKYGKPSGRDQLPS